MKKYLGLKLVLLFIIFFIPKESLALNYLELPKDLFKAMEQKVSRWNPIGHALAPLEEAIPGLDITGFLENETDFMLNRRDNWRRNPQGIPFRPKRSYTFQKIEWLNELEIRYKPQETWQFVTIADFLYDSAFDWDSRFRHWFNDSRDLQEWKQYRNDRILRELYIDLYLPSMDNCTTRS